MAKSKFFRVAIAGQTTDGRTIEPNWLDEMAAGYNPETYSARVNMEHIRGYSADLPFRAYGDVLALKADDVSIELGGKTEKRRALFAQIDATDDLVALNQQRQKLFSSVEIAPNFAGTGKAYLVGLAVTDSPASLGTEMLAFAAQQGENNPLANRKQDAANLFSAADQALELELEPDAAAADDTAEIKGLVQLAREFFTGLKKPAEGEGEGAATPPATPPATPANDNLSAQLEPLLTQFASTVEAANKGTNDAVTALTARVDELAGKLDTTAAPFTQRPVAAGGGNRVRTDC